MNGRDLGSNCIRAARTLALVLLCLAAVRCVAQQPDRQPVQEVFRTDLVYTQDRGEIQITSGINSVWSHGDRVFAMPVQTEYGLTDTWQLQLEWDGWQHIKPFGDPASAGAGDVSVGVKRSLMNLRRTNSHLALTFDLGLPTGDLAHELGEGLYSAAPSIILAHDFFPHARQLQVFTQTGVELMLGTKWPSAAGPAPNRFNWSGGAFFVAKRSLILSSELTWQNDRWNHAGRQNTLYATPGTVWKLPLRLELGLGASVGLTPGSERFGVRAQLTREFQPRRAAD